MKSFSGYDAINPAGEFEPLPVGGYICKILHAEVKASVNDPTMMWLAVDFDIDDGPYTGYYQQQFANTSFADARWGGTLRVFIPRDDGSDKDEWTKRSFKGFTTSVENSNPAYTWDWDEAKLAGKEVGIIYRNEEWEYNGRTGWKAKPFRACSSDTIVDGRFKIPKKKPLSNNRYTPLEDDSELPF